MQVIQKFDPWNSPLCSCPPKFSLNPYTGCSHRCIYCYATYIPNFYHPRPKKNFIEKIKKDLKNLPENSLISLSNSSDPYLPEEKTYKLTRKFLQEFKNYNLRLLIITKSDLLLRDLDILKNLKVAVTFTITSLNPEIYKKLEPNAPLPEKRIKAIEKLTQAGIKVGVRFDPIFPFLNDKEAEKIIKTVKKAGSLHIISSTFKPRRDSWQRFKKAFPQIAKKLEKLYFEKGEKIQNSWYLPKKFRKTILLKVKKICDKEKISFSCCREGFLELNSAKSCDGSHLIPQ